MTEPQEPENSTRRLPTVESAPSGGVLEMDQSASGSSYEPAPAREEPGGRAGRFWSGRRIPAALVALVVLGGADSCSTTSPRCGPTTRPCSGGAPPQTTWRAVTSTTYGSSRRRRWRPHWASGCSSSRSPRDCVPCSP